MQRTAPTEPIAPTRRFENVSGTETSSVATSGDTVYSSEIAAAVGRIVDALTPPRVISGDQAEAFDRIVPDTAINSVTAPDATEAAELLNASIAPIEHSTTSVASAPQLPLQTGLLTFKDASLEARATAIANDRTADGPAAEISPYWPGAKPDAEPATATAAMPNCSETDAPTPAVDTRKTEDEAGYHHVADSPHDAAVGSTAERHVPDIAAELPGEGPWARFRTAARYVGMAVATWLATLLLLIAVYRFVNPPVSNLMVYQWLTGVNIERHWVPIDRISPQLVRAVILSEDGRYCEHNGIDMAAIEEAIENANDGLPRGASTISMQVIKNLFLWQSKSYVRKAIEIPLTLVAEVAWPKRRMLEIYLNIAEWGPGVFGAEAAAQHHFNKPAAQLGQREAALLAASLPNPMIRDAGDPGPRTRRKASIIQARMRASGPIAACMEPREP